MRLSSKFSTAVFRLQEENELSQKFPVNENLSPPQKFLADLEKLENQPLENWGGHVQTKSISQFSLCFDTVLFSGTHIHVCDFHREKAWSEWLSKAEHGVSDMKGAVLEDLRRIATSADALTLGKNIQTLKESAAWKKSIHLQEYFNSYWGRHLTVSKCRPCLIHYLYTTSLT